MRRGTWTGKIQVQYVEKGGRTEVFNAILDAGFELTALLWLGQSTEKFSQLVIEGAGAGDSVAKDITGSYTLATGSVTVTSTALFSSAEVSFDVETVALLGSGGTRIAEASVAIPAGSAVEITREDQLSEVV